MECIVKNNNKLTDIIRFVTIRYLENVIFSWLSSGDRLPEVSSFDLDYFKGDYRITIALSKLDGNG
jgi:hypothetical protein